MIRWIRIYAGRFQWCVQHEALVGPTVVQGYRKQCKLCRAANAKHLTLFQAPGQAVLPTVVGVMGPDFFTIRKIFEATLSTQPWLRDPDVLPIPWRKELEELPTKLTFGLLLTDGIVSPHPPITRALREVAEIVKSLGHEVSL